MARPTISNGSLSTLSGSGTTLSWSHTAEASKVLYAIIVGTVSDIVTASTRSCTFGGVAMTEVYNWSFASISARSIFVFSLTNPTAGAGTILFTSSKTAQWFGGAFNVTDGPTDGSLVLAGCYGLDNTTTLSKKGYAWNTEGTMIALVGGTGTAITNGTSVAAGSISGISRFDAADDEITVNCTRTGAGNIVLITFMLSPGNQSLVSGTHQILFTGRTNLSGFTTANTSYNGLPYGQDSGGGRACNLMLNSGTIRSMAVRLSVAPGVGRSVKAELYRSGSSDDITGIGRSYGVPTGISITISGTDTEGSLDGIDLEYYKYERFTLVYTAPLGTIPNPLFAAGSLLVDLGTSNEQMYGGGGMRSFTAAAVDVAYRKSPLHPMLLNWGTFPSSEKGLIGVDGSITELLVNFQVDVSLALDHDYYIELNGVLQDGSGGTINTQAILVNNTAGQAMARSKFTLPVLAGDIVSITGYKRNAAATDLRQMGTIKFVPTVSGKQMISGHYYVSSATDYSALPDGGYDSIDTVASEVLVQIVVPPLTALGNTFNIQGIRAYLDAAPGSGRSRIITLRKNLADSGISATVADSNTTAVGSGSVSLSAADNLSVLWDGVNTPANALQFWTIPGIAAPPSVGTIQVYKATGGNTTAVFAFTASGGLSPGSFNLSGGGVQTFNSVPAGSGYGLTETPPAGWEQESVSVSNGSPISNITVAAGETVTIIFTNRLTSPANNPSGLYELTPGKTSDEIWIDASLGVSESVPIP